MASPTVPNTQPTRNQLLYILRSAGGMIKIGISYDPEQRLRQLVTGHPFELEIAYVVTFEENLAESIERIAKAILAHCRTKERGEWFAATVEEGVEAVRQARDVHEFCRKRIPERVIEVEMVKEVRVEVPVEREVVRPEVKYVYVEEPLRQRFERAIELACSKIMGSFFLSFPFIMVILLPFVWYGSGSFFLFSTKRLYRVGGEFEVDCIMIAIFAVCLSILIWSAISARFRASVLEDIRILSRGIGR